MTAPERTPLNATPPVKPLPVITDENREFWQGAADGELRMQKCAACGHLRYPIQPLCPVCISPSFSWTVLSGRGEVFSKVVYHQAFHPAYSADTPYNLVLVQLDEGPRMFSNVVDSPVTDIAVGDRLVVTFEFAGNVVTGDEPAFPVYIPRFRRS